MPHAPTATTIIAGVAGLVPQPRAWLCDIWGVIHNGVSTYPAAIDACLRFRAEGGTVIFVSNAPRPSDGVHAQLASLRVPTTAFDKVLTSGDVTRDVLRGWRGTPTLHIGPPRDLTLFAGLDVPLTEAASADRILCSGLYDDTTETPEAYRAILAPLAARAVPMLCANPDVKVDRGGQIIYCAGAVAALYEELGGPVAYAGKPHAPIYEAARRLIDAAAGRPVRPAEILAIGDGVLTDIPGGLAAGMPTLYVSSAIHHQGPLTADAIAILFPDAGHRPHYATAALAW